MPKRKVDVIPYQMDWPKKFNEESTLLKTIFQDAAITIHHIGSTSIPGMSAKPIIDILIETNSIDSIDNYHSMMIEQGYEPKGENGIKGRRYFAKGGINRTHHVHIFEAGNPEIKRHLLFRDYMKAHPADAKAYAQLKNELAKQFNDDIDSYIAGKNAFIKGIDQKAKRWGENKGVR